MREIIGYFFIIVGMFFNLFGCFGLVRLPDFYSRLQSITKCVTLGVCSVLFGTFIIKGFGSFGIKSLLCILFLILTVPVVAHAFSRGAHKQGIKLGDELVIDKYKEDNQ